MRVHAPSRLVFSLCGCLSILLPQEAPAQVVGATFRVQAPLVELTTGSEFDASVRLDAHLDGVDSWSFGVSHDDAALELLQAELGAATQTINEGGPPVFASVVTEFAQGAGVTMAVVPCFGCGASLPAGDDYELLKMRYRVVANPAASDPCEPIETSIAFVSTLGSPAVDNVVTIMGGPSLAQFVDAAVTVRCPGSLEVVRCEGDTENVELEWVFGGPPTWDFLFLYRDSELVASLEPAATSYRDEGLPPADYHYTLVTFIVEDPANPMLLFFDCIATVIPLTVTGVEPAIGNWLGGDLVTVTGTAFTSIETMSARLVASGEEALPLEIVEVVGDTELTVRMPEASRLGRYGVLVESDKGVAELADAFSYGFARGDVNSDRLLDISDGVYMFRYLFEGGVGTPRCRDAADTNDDGRLDISDGINVLFSLFPVPRPLPPPFPGPGEDPTSDNLGCIEDL